MELLDKLHIEWQSLVMIVVILISAIIITKVVLLLIRNSFSSASERLNVDPTRYRFFKNASSFIIWLVAFAAIISLIPKLKALAITLFAGAGIMVAILGLAAQQAFSNIVSGVFIVIFRPFRVGDVIKVGSLDIGTVEDITLRHTIINSFQNQRIIIPNSVVSAETVINSSISDPRICKWVEVGISYDSDADLAMKLMQEAALEHPECIDNRTEQEKQRGEPKVLVRNIGFGESSINLRAYVWVKEPTIGFQVHSDLNRAIKKKFDENGIEIPFPYRTIVYKKDL
jgi:small-conductance mechanosensitive channel